ncbi:nickel-responsive transcriptional regulator NikR [candidate division WOR-3 bacterium]|nr:nickel-responsive transcriptional regulator NikR [candidate division WOR-3 bacterium]
MKLVRFGVSMEKELLAEFDYSIESKGYANRSEALRDLVRKCLLENKEEDPSTPAVGVIAYTYNHERRELQRRLTQIGHSRLGKIISSMHIHLDEILCLEVVVAKGTIEELRELSNLILSNRGVLYGDLILSTQPKKL